MTVTSAGNKKHKNRNQQLQQQQDKQNGQSSEESLLGDGQQNNNSSNSNNIARNYSDYLSSLIHLRCRLDILDMSHAPDGDHKFLMIYQDHRSGFICLKALSSQSVTEIAGSLIDVLCQMGSTLIVQSSTSCDHGRQIVDEVRKLWPNCLLMAGKSPSQSQHTLFEKCRNDVKSALLAWMEEKSSNRWSLGARFIQWKLNNRKENEDQNGGSNDGGGRSSPLTMIKRNAMLGVADFDLSLHTVETLETEDDLINALKFNRSQYLGCQVSG